MNNKPFWKEIHPSSELKDGDIICSYSKLPELISLKPPVYLLGDFLEGGFRKNGFTFMEKFFSEGETGTEIIKSIRTLLKTKTPLKIWRKVEPICNKMNKIYCAPLPLP